MRRTVGGGRGWSGTVQCGRPRKICGEREEGEELQADDQAVLCSDEEHTLDVRSLSLSSSCLITDRPFCFRPIFYLLESRGIRLLKFHLEEDGAFLTAPRSFVYTSRQQQYVVSFIP